ncbi:uncharacterized protein K452DRAFT_315989 [Aplosporella prunicola CBS 121167]|uniref:Arrestin-like N-terminal domain-containing protein n=1 Tax=Aplosporella prunicola CBS 121167 TaxID=1176127 RepID=A0A6A6BNY0_9PEZI|nr:uncharacterized protein K452DRAFT_315989 [Aplosporella prunicola CBS 121167]KAF2145840.1 hypothetical protein K452DRAFT_315989 [Aplosporella prunicola CBS 121167]
MATEEPLQIALDGVSARTVFCEGDVVRGKVRVDTKLQSSRVSICFKGLAISRINERQGNSHATRVSKYTLLQYDTILFSGEDIASSASEDDSFATFPFEFRFPAAVQARTYSEPSRTFESEPGHALPPTFTADVRGQPQSVQYYLEASILTMHLKIFSSEKKKVTYLNFSPVCTDPTPALSPALTTRTMSHTRQSRRLIPDYEPHGLRAHFCDLIPSSKDPSASFAVKMHLPQTIRAGHPFSISFGITHGERSADIATPPPLHLHALTVSIKAHTQVRVVSLSQICRATTRKITIAERHWDAKHGEASSSSSAPPLLLPAGGEMVPLASLLENEGQLVVPKHFTPSFKSYNIVRSYDLVAVLSIECAGKMFDVKAVGDHVKGSTVLPWPGLREAEAGERIAFAEDGAADGGMYWEDEDGGEELPPPPYEEVVGKENDGD